MKRKYTYQVMPIPDGEKIYNWVLNTGKSINELEAELGITRGTLYRIFKGKRTRITTLAKIARMMKVDVKELIKTL